MPTLAKQRLTDGVLPGQRMLIVGLGKTGLSCARFLHARGYEVAITDSRGAPPGLDGVRAELPDLAVFVDGFDAGAFERADCLVVSPGVALREPLVAEALRRGVPVLGDIEIFARYARAPVVAITGSNGKSTVTTLMGEMARYAGRIVRVGGNLGPPALELLGPDEPHLYVLELSSFQLESTASLRAAAAAVLNISEDHMDRYPTLAQYAAAKARVLAGAASAVVNADDAAVMAMLDTQRPQRVIPFTLGTPATDGYGITEQAGESWLARGDEALLEVSRLHIFGRHNHANALAALALGEAVGLARPAMLEALEHFTGLPHRCQWVARHNEVTWFNDSKATNVGATLAALEGIAAEGVVLIAGGQGKGQDFAPLREAVHRRARALVLLGEDASAIATAVDSTVPVHRVATLADAVATAAAVAVAGDAVLLSPACASFDMFDGYEDRGAQYIAAVRDLLGC
ncbi:MAG: UDP-N-acetylmuramoyl-L-alanine--D-glutamate ligase [Pseudomonadota bacterium]|nr:MAG: UDP-N-acetylmuramoyl-L-alanine--D-glutamate ligase [Pseudomonadota bacterium]